MRKDVGKENEESFFDKVYKIVLRIPPGRVTSYGAIANYLGTKGAARLVGWAMNSSHTQTSAIPAHRVVNRVGLLTGKHHFGGQKVMQQLLESEGIEVEDDKVVRFEALFWDPKKGLK
ncbi:MAG: MGMT family protein [Bacteroidales bacterium]|jgi:methylated-DNA-protein-cysteine methyltransferase-like protein